MFKRNDGFISGISILITMFIIGLFAYLMLNRLNATSFKEQPSLEEEDLGMSELFNVIDDTRDQLDDMHKKQETLQQQLKTAN